MTSSIHLGKRRIGAGEPTYVVAALSANHGQDLGEALQILGAAKRAGADAVKLHTYTPDALTIDGDRDELTVGAGGLGEGRKLHDLYSEARVPWDWYPQLQELARDLEIDLLSTPGDADAVDFLEEMETPAYKIASLDLVDLPLIRKAASTAKPLLLSTGMASRNEIGEAVAAARDAGCEKLALLCCTSAYPAPPDAVHLRAIPALGAAFGVPVGLSDHTLGTAVAVAAVALGAAVVEKHLCLSRARPGLDGAFALEPDEFAVMVAAVRTAEQALGETVPDAVDAEAPSRPLRRSLWVIEDVAAGDELNERNVRSLRPATGLAPRHLPEVLGRRAARDLARGTPLSWSDVAA